MVICGATGDLTERKLAPALYNCLLGGFLPPEFTVVGFARRDLTDDEFRAHLLEGINKYSRNRPAKPAIWESFARGIEYHRGDFDDPAAYVELAKRLDRIDRDRGTAGQPALLPRRPAGAVPRDRQPARAGRAGGARRPAPQRPEARLDPRHRREAVRLRPRERPDAEPRARRGLRRGAGLSDRPLPRQGDRPEPGRLPIRQRPVRADLEPPLHRLGPDHRGRDGRRRGPRRVLRRDRRPARHRPEPRPPADGDVRHGAAGRVRRRGPARREAQGAARREADVAGGRGDATRCAASTSPAGSRARSWSAYRDEPEVAPDSRDRDVRGAEARRSTRGAGPGSRSTSAPARRLPSRVTEIAVQFKRAPLALFARAGVPQIDPNVLAIRVQPDEGILLRFGAKVPGQGLQIRTRQHGLPLRVELRGRLAGRVRDAAARRHGRRRQPVHPRRRGRAGLGDPRPDPRGLEVGRRADRSTSTAPGRWGPPAADELLERDGRAWRRP